MPDFGDKLRRQSRFLLVVQSLGSILAGFIAWSALLVLLDLYDAFSPIQEAEAGAWILSLGIISFLVCLLFLGYIWLKRPSTTELAQKVESVHPELHDLLNSAVEIEQKGREPKFMEKRVLRELTRKSASFDWGRVLAPPSSLWKFLVLGFLLGLLLSSWNFHRSPLTKAIASLSDQPGLQVWTSLSGAPETFWKTPDAEYRRGTDVSIHTEIFRDHRGVKDASIEWIDGNQTISLPMLKKENSDQLEWLIPAFEQTFRYRVVTSSLQSSWHQIVPYDPPEIEFVRWEIIPPDYLNMPPIIHQGFGYLEVPENSSVRLDLRVKDFPIEIGARLITKDGNFSMEKVGRVTFSWKGQIEKEFSAKLGLSDLAHPDRPEILSDVVVLSPIPDEPPLVEITDPAKDLELPFDAEPLLVEVRASDDHGIAEIGLWVFHNEVEREFDLFVDPVAKDKEVTGILDLSEFPLADVDVVTYMAFAGDNREPENQIAQSDIYFIEIGHSIEEEPPAPSSDAMGQDVWEIPLRKFINRNRELIKEILAVTPLEGADKMNRALNICADALDLKNLMTIVYDDHGESFPIDAGLATGELFLDAIYNIEEVEVASGDQDMSVAFNAALRADRKLVQIWGILNKNKPPKASGKTPPQPLDREKIKEHLEALLKKVNSKPLPPDSLEGE